MQQNKTKTIVTIGNGVAAWCLHYYLKDSGVKLINISSEDFFKSCSHSSTAINCLRGTTPGNSPLGDTIIDSMDEFLLFNKEHGPAGISEGFEYQILESDTLTKWERRYPYFNNVETSEFLVSLIKDKTLFHKVPAHFIDIHKFRKWMMLNGSEVEYIKDLVVGIERIKDDYTICTRNQKINANAVVLCTGSVTHLLASNTSESFQNFITRSKQVTGGYLELDRASESGFNWDHSFVLAIEKYHFIFRKDEDIVQIGSSSQDDNALELPLESELKVIYQYIDKHTRFNLPVFEDFKFVTGIRHKGHRRRPYWGPVDENGLYAICGLYKNAFSFGFKAAKDVSIKLSKDFL